MTDGRVRYARYGDARIAYRVWGDAETTLVSVRGWTVESIDNIEDLAGPYSSGLGLLRSRARFVVYDRRGTGLCQFAHRRQRVTHHQVSTTRERPTRGITLFMSVPVEC